MMRTTLLTRYLPLIVIVLLHGALGMLADGGADVTTAGPGFTSQLQSSGGFGGGTTNPLGGGVAPGAAGVGQDVASPTADSAGAEGGPGAVGGPTGTASAGSTPTAGPQAAANTGAAQPQDALGRPLDGDRSKCAEGGLVQETVTLQSPPCMPAFVGDNGGATFRGVTGDTIKVVIVYQEYGAGVQQVLAANELAMSPAEGEEVHAVYEQFYNSRYEFYGRKLEVVGHFTPAATPIELRAEAKAIVQQHDPFAVMYFTIGLMPKALADGLAREGVLTIGVGPVADEFFLDRAPLVWSLVQGYRYADIAADYYCKRMHGKPASLAGDPTLRVRTRKLGIGSSEDPDQLAVAKRFFDQVTGGMCGSPNDGTTLYTYSSDPEVAEAQRPTLVSRMQDDGITTTYNLNPCADGDQQGYFPENFTTEMFDDDFVGRVFAALCGPTQMSTVFGLGYYAHAQPRNEKPFVRVAKSVNPDYDPPYIAEGTYQNLSFISRLIQYTGPILTPENMYLGTRSMPQIGGWENPNPWPGWECCNPFAPGYHVGISADSFTQKIDTRQIFWDSTAQSEGDGATGAWVGVDNSRRYRVGAWPPGEPKQP